MYQNRVLVKSRIMTKRALRMPPNTKLTTLNFPLVCPGVQMQNGTKTQCRLYLDRELVEKTKELGFNLSKTFENYLKHLLAQFSTVSTQNNVDLSDRSVSKWGCPDLNRGLESPSLQA